MSALPKIGGSTSDLSQPTSDQKQRYALRQCFLLAIRMARREQKADDSRSSEWNRIIRFCKDADVDGNICGSNVLRQSDTDPRCPLCGDPVVDRNGRPNSCGLGPCPLLARPARKDGD